METKKNNALKAIEVYAEAAKNARVASLEFIKERVAKTSHNALYFNADEDFEDDNVPAYLFIHYDGGSHPEYNSSMLCEVFSLFLDEDGKLCLELDVCECYDEDRLDTASLVTIVTAITENENKE